MTNRDKVKIMPSNKIKTTKRIAQTATVQLQLARVFISHIMSGYLFDTVDAEHVHLL